MIVHLDFFFFEETSVSLSWDGLSEKMHAYSQVVQHVSHIPPVV